MKNENSKKKNATIALAAAMIILALILLCSVIGGYAAAAENAKSCLKISDTEAQAIAENLVPDFRGYAVKRVEKKVRFDDSVNRIKGAYYLYEVEFSDKFGGNDMDVYVDGRNGLVVKVDY